MSHKRIIVVDDDPSIRHLLTLLLDEEGYQVETYADPTLCPTLCRDDLLLTDMHMPPMTGLEFIRRQPAETRPIHAAVMSGALSECDRKHLLSLGCQVFSKPLDLASLCGWLSSIPLEPQTD